jgi:hypothetical protein
MSDNPIVPLTPQEEAQQRQSTAREGYWWRCLVALDIFSNVLLGGHEDETISSRSARAAEQGKWWGIAMCKFLNLFQADHGPKAQSGDIERAEEVEKLEKDSGGFTK